jgi:hypothetical protein
MLIGLSGKIGSGKNTAANYFAKYCKQKYPNVVHHYFAFKLKQIVEILTGIKMKQSFSDNYFSNGITDFTNEDKNIFIPEFNATIGQLLQIIGTNVFRDNFDREVWIKSLFVDYDTYEKNNSLWIITDVRFTNEATAIKDFKGVLVRINRNEDKSDNSSARDKNHPSEIALDNYEKFDYIINNNGTLEELENKIKQIVTKL